ncbi:unnamed protein product, partial [Effrenium voratum]
DRATYLPVANWMGPDLSVAPNVSDVREFYPICVFDWAEDHEIWRHMDGNYTRGYIRKTVVVRSIATVGNYDYIMDVKFREETERSTWRPASRDTRRPGTRARVRRGSPAWCGRASPASCTPTPWPGRPTSRLGIRRRGSGSE